MKASPVLCYSDFMLKPISRYFNFRNITFPLLLLIFSFQSIHCVAQVENASLQLNPNSDTTAACTYVVELTDTMDVAVIEVALGTSGDYTDMFLYQFFFDQFTGLPAGMGYLRQGDQVEMQVGNIVLQEIYYGRVRIKNSAGQWSNAYLFMQN